MYVFIYMCIYISQSNLAIDAHHHAAQGQQKKYTCIYTYTHTHTHIYIYKPIYVYVYTCVYTSHRVI